MCHRLRQEVSQRGRGLGALFTSGLANELAGTKIIDWPGRPGTRVSDYSTHQIEEYAFLEQEEYPELLRDFTGFMLRKYIPRAFPKLEGLKGIAFDSPFMMNTSMLSNLYSPDVLGAMQLLARIGQENAKEENIDAMFETLEKYGKY